MEKIKIALLTFHNAANFGAALQAYALQKFLLKNGFYCEYINYENKYRHQSYSVFSQLLLALQKKNFIRFVKVILGSPFLSLRKFRFNIFYKNHIKKTNNLYKTENDLKVLNGKYDLFIVGSDQVWNPNNNGEDMSYLLSFVDDDRKKISYSSSFGVSSLSENLEKKYAYFLSKFQSLSVRESFGVDFIDKLTGKKAKLVLDPVFLLSKEDWMDVMKRPKSHEKYVFVYTNEKDQFSQFLQTTHYDMTDKKEYILSSHTRFIDFLILEKKVKFSMSPSDFISAIFYAELVVTASFHCIALSILLNIPFVAILTGNEGKDERVISLLRLTGLTDRILESNMTREDVNSCIDYTIVNEKLLKYKQGSIDFLISSIQKSN